MIKDTKIFSSKIYLNAKLYRSISARQYYFKCRYFEARLFCSQVTLVLSSVLLAVMVSAAPQNPESRAAILSQDAEVKFDGTFKNKYAKIIHSPY